MTVVLLCAARADTRAIQAPDFGFRFEVKGCPDIGYMANRPSDFSRVGGNADRRQVAEPSGCGTRL